MTPPSVVLTPNPYPIQHLMTTFDLGGGICFHDLLYMRTVYVVVPQL